MSEGGPGADRLSARDFRVGDEVELAIGNYAGMRGKITAKRPRLAPFATHILVDVELPKHTDPNYEYLRVRFKKWQRAAIWKRAT